METTGSNDDPWLYFIYDSSWRAVASVFAVDNGAGTESGEYLAKADDDPRELFVFHTAGLAGRGTSSKLDDVILRDRDFNVGAWGVAGDGTCEQRTYYAQNWRGDVVATLDSTGARRETIRYSTYGLPFGIASGDVDGSGSVVAGDASAVNAQIGKSYGVSGYTVLLDVDLDGDVDVNDYNIANGQSGLTLGHSVLSAAPTTADGGNRMGYAGYAWEPVSSKYAVRHRVFDPLRGRWSRRDPLGYVDSPTLYGYVNDQAMAYIDPTGQLKLACKTGCCATCEGADDVDVYGLANGLVEAQGGAQQGVQPSIHPECRDAESTLPGYSSCCEDACDDYKKNPKNSISKLYGITVCCQGTLVSCFYPWPTKNTYVWQPPGSVNSSYSDRAQEAIRICTLTHEQHHQDQHIDPANPCPPPGPSSWADPNTYIGLTTQIMECDARTEEVTCLEGYLNSGWCDGYPNCKSMLESFVKIKRESRDFYCSLTS